MSHLVVFESQEMLTLRRALHTSQPYSLVLAKLKKLNIQITKNLVSRS